ncbi:hypothetical protein C2845_PM05G02270 [Panicum miliaceum]|uniref:Ubiquitin-like protease family profile domain-containing protein n=1 Tax=Panicum miliaceum TaxID=4540 RepID=A0A3L6ST95_PANMI|nr:hypothetical protein C2845_PM05G02270 [Panicum miliaceum]
MANVHLRPGADRRSSPLCDKDGVLRSGTVYKAAMTATGSSGCQFYEFVWCNRAPPRTQFFTWLLVQERIQCRVNLLMKNIILDATCEVCQEAPEDCDHLVFRCPFSAAVWATLGVDTTDCRVPKFQLSPDDINSLDANNSVNDPVINWVFKDLMSNLERNGIYDVLLMDPSLSYLMLFDPDDSAKATEAQMLSSCRLVLLPVNNNSNPDQSGGGNHWSLIVFDQWTQYGPRLLHYDSADGSNFNTADRLANMMQRHLLIGTADLMVVRTPQQGNDNNCALFVIAIAKSICSWCERAAAGGQEADWSATLFREVDDAKVAKLRIELHKRAQRQNNDEGC